MHPDELFLRVIDDLHDKVDNGNDDYAVLRAAGLLRLLLIDGNDLLTVVNRSREIKIRFRVRSAIQFGLTTNQWAAIGPAIAPDSRYPTQSTKLVSVDQLLKLDAVQVGTASGQWLFRVRDVIKFVCHVLGGVHYGEPRDDADQRLMEVMSQTGSEDQLARAFRTSNFVRSTVLQVSNVVLDGVSPLVQAIQGD